MVEQLFLQLLFRSLAVTPVIVAVLAVRQLLKRTPRIFSYLLWTVVWFRLLCPFSLESEWGLLPELLPDSFREWQGMLQEKEAAGREKVASRVSGEGIRILTERMGRTEGREWTEGTGILAEGENAGKRMEEGVSAKGEAGIIGSFQSLGSAGAVLIPILLPMAAGIWIAGVLLLSVSQLWRMLSWRRRLALARKASFNEAGFLVRAVQPGKVVQTENTIPFSLLKTAVYRLEGLETAFVWGILRPAIYLPAGLGEAEERYILQHEEIHIRRRDLLVQAIAWLAVCLYWFHPLVWLSFRQMEDDRELSCDEAVLRKLGNGIKKGYAASLVEMAAGSLATGKAAGRMVAGRAIDGVTTENRTAGSVVDGLSAGRAGWLQVPHFSEGKIEERVRHVLKYQKVSKWSAAAALLVVVAVGIGLVFCHPSGAAKQPDGTSVVFPAYQGGKNEYNSWIYETEPFTAKLELPEGWHTALPSEEEQKPDSPWTPVDILDGENQKVGIIGFGRFETTEETEEVPSEEYYKVAFSEIRLGSVISWCNEYQPVKTDEQKETAVCRIYFEDENGAEQEAPGVVAYDRQREVYLAVGLAAESVTEEELIKIAESVEIAER